MAAWGFWVTWTVAVLYCVFWAALAIWALVEERDEKKDSK